MKQIQVRLTKAEINKFMLFFSLSVILFTSVLYSFTWGIDLSYGFKDFMFFYLTYFILIILHELLHILGFVYIGRGKWKDVKMGVLWKSLTPYAHCSSTMSIKAYKISGLMPLWILGILPMVYGFLLGEGAFVFYGALLTIGAGGDILMYLKVKCFPESATVKDSPTEIGCDIFIEEGGG